MSAVFTACVFQGKAEKENAFPQAQFCFADLGALNELYNYKLWQEMKEKKKGRNDFALTTIPVSRYSNKDTDRNKNTCVTKNKQTCKHLLL